MRPVAPTLSAFDLALYGATLFAWSTSWIALKMQLGTVTPVVSVFWRFVIAASIVFIWARLAGYRLRFPLADHLRFMALGVLIFSTNFVLFYYGGQHLASGLLSVVFSLASVINMLLAALFLGQALEARVALGAAIGISGIALVFWPEIAGTEFNHEALIGLAFCVSGTLSFSFGNMVSAAGQKRGLPVVSTNAWGMAYGALALGLFALVRGDSFAIEFTPSYIGSLLWLAVIASVIAFAAYLTLLGRIGSGRAGYLTVMFPVIALAISTFAEGYRWTLPAIVGLMLVLAGNVVILTRRRAR
ncbi:MAG: DMT family transporter [Hyphomicrobiales bacterium]